MKPINPLSTLMAIIKAIKDYCFQSADYRDPAENKSLNAYLRRHLSGQNWSYWKALPPAERAAFVNNQVALPDNGSTLDKFLFRLAQDTVTTHEAFKFWHHAQHKLLTSVKTAGKEVMIHEDKRKRRLLNRKRRLNKVKPLVLIASNEGGGILTSKATTTR